MATPKQLHYEKRGKILVKNLQSRHFDAYHCATKEEALKKALELIPKGASVGWGGALSAQEIGLMDALNAGNYNALDRERCQTPEEREQNMRDCMFADVYLTGANGLSLDGQMVNIDGTGNRVAATIFGPKSVLVAAPLNKARLGNEGTPCAVTGACGDCKAERCICNQIVITRHCRPVGRIKFILVGEDLGL